MRARVFVRAHVRFGFVYQCERACARARARVCVCVCVCVCECVCACVRCFVHVHTKPCSRHDRAALIQTSAVPTHHSHRQQPPLPCQTPILPAAQIQPPSPLLPHTPRYSCPQEPASPPADAEEVP